MTCANAHLHNRYSREIQWLVCRFEPRLYRLYSSENMGADMQEIHQKGGFHYAFSRYVEPIATVQPGETVTLYTVDAFENRITRESDRHSVILPPYLNPQTGAIVIEGAAPGDRLAVHILNIEPTRGGADKLSRQSPSKRKCYDSPTSRSCPLVRRCSRERPI